GTGATGARRSVCDVIHVADMIAIMETAVLTTSPSPKVFRPPAWARYFSLVGTIVLGAVTALMLAAAVFLLFKGAWGLAAFVALVAWFMAALTGYVLRDLTGKWGLRVELGP